MTVSATPESVTVAFPWRPGEVGFWKRGGEEVPRYAPRTWNDVVAALPLARADRFGPAGYFETARVGGTGSPVVLLDGLVWPRDAGGLTNANAWPRGGIASIGVATPRLFPRLALAAPDGAILLEPSVRSGGSPESYVDAERGVAGYRAYRFGFAREVTARLGVIATGRFRKADVFLVDSYRAFESDLRARYRIGRRVVIRAGMRRYKDEQVLLDKDLVGQFSHDGEDARRVSFVEAVAEGMVARLYGTRIHSVATERSAEYAGVDLLDERRGFLLSGTRRTGAVCVDVALRGEEREATVDRSRREDRSGAVAASVALRPLPVGEIRLSAIDRVEGGEPNRASGEGVFAWGGRAPGLVRVGRAWERRTTRRWVEAEKEPGIVRFGEVGIGLPFLPASPTVRYFRREGDAVDYLYSLSAFEEDRMEIEERVDGVELTTRGRRGELAWEGAYLWAKSREAGEQEILPYQSEHLVRGRLGYACPVPFVPAVPRWDLLAEWRSDRRAPGRSEPMGRYFYLRGRVTIRLRGTDLFAQMEQVLGHQNEYLEGPTAGSDGVLSGSQQLYLGVHWPFRD